MRLFCFLSVISGSGIASAHTNILSASIRHEVANSAEAGHYFAESSIMNIKDRTEVTSMIPQPTVAANSTYLRPHPDKKGGGHGGGGSDGNGSGSDGDGAPSGSGSEHGGGGHISAARNLLLPKKVLAWAVFTTIVWQRPGLRPLALLTLPALAQAQAVTDASFVALPPNSTNTTFLGMDIDKKGSSRGPGYIYISGASSSLKDLLVSNRVIAGAALAVLAPRRLVSLPLIFLAFAAVARTETPISTSEHSPAVQSAPTATEIVEYNISGIPYTIVLDDKSNTATSVSDVSTESLSAIVFSTATTTIPRASEVSSSMTTSTIVPSRVLGGASGNLSVRYSYGLAALGMALVSSLVCHYV
ncbi:hypothetical protein MMC11_006299 [Xylographa trunciseda]|nr:hypothetical protein [Xylographa trunciseda]